MSDPRTEKLPMWAQKRMALLERNADYWQAKYHEGPEDSDTFVETYIGDGRPLGKSPQIRFALPEGSKITASLRDGKLSIYSVGTNGFDGLAVRPNSNNSITIEVPTP